MDGLDHLHVVSSYSEEQHGYDIYHTVPENQTTHTHTHTHTQTHKHTKIKSKYNSHDPDSREGGYMR